MAHAASAAPARPPLLDPKRVRRVTVSAGLFLAVLMVLWEGFKAFCEAVDLRLGQFEPNDRTMPYLHDIVGTLFEPSRRNGPLPIDTLWDAALFTAKEAAVGFALGALVGFALGAALARACSSAASCRTSLPRRRSRSSRSPRWSSSG
jgi:ABC-type nitrate/sulfonate/bicarbonate transport system permease component